MAAVLNQAEVRALLSREHFSVDGMLVEARSSMKSFRLKDGSGAPPQCGARLYRKSSGDGAKALPLGHLMIENWHGLIVETELLGRGTQSSAWQRQKLDFALVLA
jgi:hypothetical protein